MLSANTIIPITKYDLSTDSASVVYEIAVGASPIQLNGTTSARNSNVTIVKDGLQDTVTSLETSATINYLASANTATATGLLLNGSGIASTIAATTSSGTSSAFLPIVFVSSADGSNIKVTLPAIAVCSVYTVVNTSVRAISVYPVTGDFINALAVNTSVSIAAGGTTKFYTKASSLAATAKKGWFSL